MALRVERSDDLRTADEIKELFLRNDRPSFPEQFDVAYPEARGGGGASWLSREDEGRVVGHIAVFPRLIRSANREYRAVVFGDLMFDETHRNFFAPVQLARAASSDLRKSGNVDFAFASAIEIATGVLRGGGMKIVSQMQRYVRPLNLLYHLFSGLRSGAKRLDVARFSSPWEDRVAEALAAIQPDSYLRGARTLTRYSAHLGRESAQTWDWLVMRQIGERNGPPAALALVSYNSQIRTATILDITWDDNQVSAASVLHGLAGTVRATGYSKLAIWALTPSRFSAELLGAGFFARDDKLAFLTREFHDGGMPPLEDFLPTFMDGTSW